MVVAKGKTPNESTKLVDVLFEQFATAIDSVEILLSFHKLKAAVGAEKVDNGKEVYTTLKSKLQSWKCKSLWDVLDARAKHKEYGNQKICEDLQVLVIGSGPIGLRTAIEVALLGAKVIVVEKRTSFSRNNVLHLWPFLIHDFRSLGAKRFYGKFCSGSLDHIGIRTLQCLLMKAALILGVQIYTGVTFEKVIEPTSECGWRCQVDPPFHPASQLDLDMIVGADGKKNVLPNFQQIEMRGSLAIGITLNLVYHGTKEEAAIPEVSGLAYHFKPEFFDKLYQRHGVRLENFVYYKGETHYFVMTAVKSSLIARGALLMDYPKPAELLAPHNVNNQRLIEYALDAVNFGTEGKLTDVEFVKNDRGKSDIAVFDFTSLKKAEHAARIVERRGHRLLMALVGDSLIEPVWPTGSGCARGVLSALDTAWMLRSFAMDRPPLQVLSERENIYKLLSATTVNNLRKKFEAYTINPFTRYVDLSLKRVKEVYHLYDSDDPVNADFRVRSPSGVGSFIESTRRRISVSNQKAAKIGRNRRKSSSDDLDEKKGRIRSRQSSSDDLDEKKDIKNRRKSLKKALSQGRYTDVEQNDITGNSRAKSKKKKKLRSQSSESADEKEIRARRQRKLGRTKSRDTDGSNNSLDTITESPKTVAKNEANAENKDNSVLMKQRSTKRWRLFGGTKPKNSRSVDKEVKANSNENLTDIKNAETQHAKSGNVSLKKSTAEPKNTVETEVAEKRAPASQAKNELPENRAGQGVPANPRKNVPQNRLGRTVSKNATGPFDHKEQTKGSPVTETYEKSSLRQLNSQESSPKQLRSSLKKTRELRQTQSAGFTRSISNGTSVLPGSQLGPINRINRDVKQTDRDFINLTPPREKKPKKDPGKNDPNSPKGLREKTGVEKENKRARLVSNSRAGSVTVLDDIKSLSPAAQRTAPLLKTLTPDKRDTKYNDGGAVTAAAGIAAMLALTTPLAIEGQQTFKELEIERKKILASSKVSVKDKIALLNSGMTSRRDLASALDSVDGGNARPVKRFFSFTTAQRNVKQKIADDSYKSLTLPKKAFSRQSLQEKGFSAYPDISSALDSSINILIKSYSFVDLKGTLKLMLNIFRCISKDPDNETPRRVLTAGQLFGSLVWDVKEARLFMVVSGWMEIGSFIIFPKTKTVHEPIRVLMQNYRQLWEKHSLNTSYPQFVPPESAVKHRRCPSDEVFHLNTQYDRNGREDSGSNSGSDSGMGFSETASEHNLPAVMPAEHDTIADDVSIDVVKRSSQVLDPRMYLEESYSHDEPVRKLEPSDYLNESTAVIEKPSTTSVCENPKILQSKPETTQHYPNNPSGYINLPSKMLSKHYWEVLEEPNPIPQSPDEIRYAPSHNETLSSQKRANFRENKKTASFMPMDEPMDYDPSNPLHDPNLPVADTGISKHPKIEDLISKPDKVVPKETNHDKNALSGRQRTPTKPRNELDDLFETLDYVSEALEPPRVVYDDKTPVDEHKPKKRPGTANSTEASRCREEYTRSNFLAEDSTSRTTRAKRNQVANGKRRGGEIPVTIDGQQDILSDQRSGRQGVSNDHEATFTCTDRKINSRRQRNDGDKNPANDITRTKQRRNHSPDQSSNEPLRRSQRIAESSNRKAVLVLDSSGYLEESSTDLNLAFVDSALNESKQEAMLENDNDNHEKSIARKKKVRRQSSVVKTSKSRVRTKRTGYKSRKDRSVDT